MTQVFKRGGAWSLLFAAIAVMANTAPEVHTKRYDTFVKQSISGNALTGAGAVSGTADSDPDGDYLTVSGWGTPSQGVIVSLTEDGDFTYLPQDDATGTDSFTYTVSDAHGGVVPSQVLITLMPIRADLAVAKSAPASATAGAALEYMITISSVIGHGLTDADNVTVTDTLPLGVVYTGISAPSEWGCALAFGAITCDAATLPPGYSDQITVYTNAPATEGRITNSVTVRSDTTDPNAANDTATASTRVDAASADLAVTCTDTPDPVPTADTLTYQIDVVNHGSSDAYNVQVDDILPTEVQFIGIDGGSDWSCSQGTYAVCQYVAHSGTLSSGSAAAPILIEVTTPATDNLITNEVSVSSDVDDPDTSNNSVREETTVAFETVTEGTGGFGKYLQYNLFGDMKLIGNANLNKRPSEPDQNYNDNVNMDYVDDDSDGSTFNSTFSTLTLDPSYAIVWAGLYWAGKVCNTGSGKCVWSHSGYSGFSTASPHIHQVRFKTPNRSNYITVTANAVYKYERSSTDWNYGAFADVTALLDPHEFGTYGLADLVVNEGKGSSGGNYGGWCMLVIYDDPAGALHYKNVSVFNGFNYINADDFGFDINGFVTPLSGPVSASLAFFAGDGDPSDGGVARMRLGLSSADDYVGGDASNPTGNLFNSTIAEFGTPINAGITKTYGIDADRVDVSAFMDNGQQDTHLAFDVATPSGGVDWYSLGMFAFATDLVSPIIDGFDKKAKIVEQNGTVKTGAEDVAIYPGSELIYTLTFSNTGDEIAEQVEIFDDFDFDGLSALLDLNNFDASKIKLSVANSTTWQSSPDCGYRAGANRVYCRLSQVGIGDTYIMQFSVTIANVDPAQDVNVTNTAYAKYKNPTTGSYVTLISDANGNFGGKSNTFNAGTLQKVPGGPVTYATGPFDAWDPFRDLDDRNISTKIVNKSFDLNISSLNSMNNGLEIKPGITARFWLMDMDTMQHISGGGGMIDADQDSSILASFKVAEAHRNVGVELSVCSDYNGTAYTLHPDPDCAAGGYCAYLTQQGLCKRGFFAGDLFAVRPKAFDVNLSSGDQLPAGAPLDLQFVAIDEDGTQGDPLSAAYRSEDYNETEMGSFFVDLNMTGSPNCAYTTANNAPPVAFQDGLFATPTSLDHVGLYEMNIYETSVCEDRYAAVDCDDKDVSPYWTKGADLPITSRQITVQIVPDHFGVDAVYADHGNKFTYLSNFDQTDGKQIASELNLTITAQTGSGATALNYSSDCMARGIDVLVNYTTNGADLGNLTEIQYYEKFFGTPVDTRAIALQQFDMDFNKTIFVTGDKNGTAELMIRLNFDRNSRDVVEPFVVTMADVTLKDEDDVESIIPIDQNSTYLYGRAHAPRYRVGCDTTGSCNSDKLEIYYEFYSRDVDRALREVYAPDDTCRSKDAISWFQNTLHAVSDGKVQGVSQSGMGYTSVLSLSSSMIPAETTIQYSGGNGYPFKTTMRISVPSWLIYNQFDTSASYNEFALEYNLGDAGKVGVDALGESAIDGPANTSRRIRW